ncbi:class I SAM-dependent methyltransferase [Pseudonocardia kujensis]|uniref:class I SAM-dependent DNA methyltransferase n=1 Tax=Pseudonocardia kujensis TaxID=1128675 RepID=UPI001E4BC6BF|nr:methyltransferase domain-containing protein [Pseudonocardia kujensis]MCE0764528.1 class I SAM-dependent methyltransferase [Pseudonocardia kujensis]
MIESSYLRATRTGYDAIAVPYDETFRSELAESPFDRAMLAGFAELVAGRHPDGQLIEVGSGPGHVTAHLHGLGLSIRGVDLSAAMVDLARREHPEITFDVGQMGALDVPDGSLAGLVAWYSIIHIPPAHLPAVFAEFHRVLTDGGLLLVGFQVGDDVVHYDEAFGHQISLDFHRLQPSAVAALLDDAGFDLVVRQVRAPEPTSAATKIPQASLIACKRP